MKKIILDRICFGISILMLTALSCDRNGTESSNLPTIKNYDQFADNSQILTIQDKSGDNKLTLRIRCKNSTLLTEFVSSEWVLVTMINQDIGIEPLKTDDDYSATKSISPIDKMQIEFVKIELQANIVGYYIEKKINPNKLNNQFKNKLIETEFISSYESLGGFLQIATVDYANGNSIRYIAETLDDPMVAPSAGTIELNEEHQYLSIGFSDVNGLVHSWRVTVRHGLSTFPIVYWIGEAKRLSQYP